MILPDLAKELAFWREKLNLGAWQITMRYERDPRDPLNPETRVAGYCERQPHIPKADIVIRTPTAADQLRYTHDTIIHELLHVRLGLLDGSALAEENVVWPLAALLTELRVSAPAKAVSLCKALSRIGTLPAAQIRPRAGKRNKMDEEKSAALAALAMKAGELMAAGQVPEELRSILEQLIALAAGGAAPEAEEPAEPQTKEPAIGMKDEPKPPVAKATKIDPSALAKLLELAIQNAGGSPSDALLKALQEEQAADRAAAVDGQLDTRSDLTAEARARFREIGIREGVAVLRKDLATLAPPKAEPQATALAKLGADKLIRGGHAATLAKASGDSKMDRLFRLMPDASEGNGFKISDRSDGKLCTASIVGALATVRAATQASVSRAKAKMGFGSEEAS